MASIMQEALVTPDIRVELREVPIPKPKAGEVLVKVAASGTHTAKHVVAAPN